MARLPLLIFALAATLPPAASADHAPLPVAGELAIVGLGFVRADATGHVFEQVEPPSFPGAGVVFEPGGRIDVAVGSNVGPIFLYDQRAIGHGGHGITLTDPLADAATALAISPSGEVVEAVRAGAFLSEIYHSNIGFSISRPPTLLARDVADVDLAADGCTAFYASSSGVGRADTCSGTALTDFASMATAAVRILPDKTVLVAPADGGALIRLREDGSALRSYGDSARWAAIDLAPDGNSFWAATAGGLLYRFDLVSGTRLAGPIDVGMRVADLAVYGAPHGAVPRIAPQDVPQRIALDGVSSLTGETAASVLAHASHVAPAGCSETARVNLDVRATGRSVGPFEGAFHAEGTAVIGLEPLGEPSGLLGLPSRRVTNYTGAFTVAAAETTVNGTVRLGDGAMTGICSEFRDRAFPNSVIAPPHFRFSGYYTTLRGVGLAYDAKLARGSRVYFDRGTTDFAYVEYALSDAERPEPGGAGNAKRYIQSFVSDLVGVTEPFVRNGETRRHTAAVPANIPELELSVHWQNPADRFTIAAVTQSGRATAGSVQKPKPRVTVRRTAKSVTATVTGLRPGRLDFRVKAERVKGKRKVQTVVRRRKHRPRYSPGLVRAGFGMTPSASNNALKSRR